MNSVRMRAKSRRLQNPALEPGPWTAQEKGDDEHRDEADERPEGAVGQASGLRDAPGMPHAMPDEVDAADQYTTA
jgi:hypothetical protein